MNDLLLERVQDWVAILMKSPNGDHELDLNTKIMDILDRYLLLD